MPRTGHAPWDATVVQDWSAGLCSRCPGAGLHVHVVRAFPTPGLWAWVGPAPAKGTGREQKSETCLTIAVLCSCLSPREGQRATGPKRMRGSGANLGPAHRLEPSPMDPQTRRPVRGKGVCPQRFVSELGICRGVHAATAGCRGGCVCPRSSPRLLGSQELQPEAEPHGLFFHPPSILQCQAPDRPFGNRLEAEARTLPFRKDLATLSLPIQGNLGAMRGGIRRRKGSLLATGQSFFPPILYCGKVLPSEPCLSGFKYIPIVGQPSAHPSPELCSSCNIAAPSPFSTTALSRSPWEPPSSHLCESDSTRYLGEVEAYRCSDWHISLSVVPSRLSRAIASIRTPFLPKAEQHSLQAQTAPAYPFIRRQPAFGCCE